MYTSLEPEAILVCHCRQVSKPVPVQHCLTVILRDLLNSRCLPGYFTGRLQCWQPFLQAEHGRAPTPLAEGPQSSPPIGHKGCPSHGPAPCHWLDARAIHHASCLCHRLVAKGEAIGGTALIANQQQVVGAAAILLCQQSPSPLPQKATQLGCSCHQDCWLPRGFFSFLPGSLPKVQILHFFFFFPQSLHFFMRPGQNCGFHENWKVTISVGP